MASNIQSMLSFLLLFTFSLETYFVNSHPLSSDPSNKVSVELYYESLSRGSMEFITDYLPEFFDNNLISIVDFHFYPWGNAHILKDNTFDCTHGEDECLLNTMEACAIDTWPDVRIHFDFIFCVEAMASDNKFSQWEYCFTTTKLDRRPIDECYHNERGKQLGIGYAHKTSYLKPPLKNVPWVVVDGTPLYDDYENFMTYICKAYKGSPRPEACNNLSVIRKVQASHKYNFSRINEVYSSKDDTTRAKIKKLLRSEMIHM